MRLIMGGINGDYLRNLVEEAGAFVDKVRVTESVWAAVAYATEAKGLGFSNPLVFRQRHSIKILGASR
jgi:hypothetical protein